MNCLTQKNRFEKFSVQCDQLVFDYSKQRIDQQVLDELIGFCSIQELASWIQRFFSEEKINYTEQRAAMHWALRQPGAKKFPCRLIRQVHQQLERMYALVEKIHAGQYRGATGEVIQDVVNIGVGGSDLGPVMVSLMHFRIIKFKLLKH